MREIRFFSVVLICLQIFHQGQSEDKGKTDDKLLLLDNYIPAAMQVIFYLTDAMKYEIKPVGPGPTSTTVRPTPPHKPGNYAPEVPLGPAGYYKEGWRTEDSFVRRSPGYIGVPGEGLGNKESQYVSELFSGVPDLDLLEETPRELLHQINTLGDFDTIGDEDDDVLRFSLNYDDSPNLDYLRQKKVPPTRAYVTLLSLYDALNKEAKEKNLNKYNGYVDRIITELIKTSQGSSEEQLKFVLSKILETRNTRKANIVKKIKTLIEDIDTPDSYLNDALRYVPPLQFSL